MSKTVDEKIVEMRFDNSEFDNNVKDSMSVIDKLKEKLTFEGASDGFKNIEKSANNFSLDGMVSGIEAIEKRFSTMGIIGMTVLQNLTNSAIEAAKTIAGQIASGGKNRAMNIQQARFQIEGLEAGAWERMYDPINESVTDTAYGFDEAAKAASLFYATGINTAESMLGALKAVAGVAATTSSDYSSIADIFGTIAGNGRVMGMQLTQLATHGLNAAATMAKYFNSLDENVQVTEQDIRQMVSDGEVSFQQFADAMSWAFGEHAKDANKTFTGSMANMKAALNRIGADIYTPFIDTDYAAQNLIGTFNALKAVIKAVHNGIKPFLTTFAKGVYLVFGDLNEKLNGYAESITKFFANKIDLSPVADVIDDNRIPMAIQNVIGMLENLGKAVFSWVKPIANAFERTFSLSIKDIVLFTYNLRAFAKSLILSSESSSNLEDTFAGVFSIAKLGITIIKNLIKVVKPIGKIFSSIGRVLLSITGVLGTIVESVVNIIESTGAIDFIAGLIANLFDYVAKLFDKVANFLAENDAIKNFFTGIASAIGDAITKIAEFAREHNLLERAATAISSAFTWAYNSIKDFIAYVYNLPFVQKSIQIVSQVVSDFSKSFGDTFENAVKLIKDFIDRTKELDGFTLENIKTAFRDFYENVLGVMAQRIKDYFKGNKIFDSLVVAFEKTKDFLFKMGGWFEKAFGIIKTAIIRLVEFLKDKVNITPENIAIIGVLVLFVGVVKGLIDLFDTVVGLIKKVTGIVETVSNGLGEALSGIGKSFQSVAIERIAISIFILASALWLIATIPAEQLESSMAALVAIAAGLLGFAEVLAKLPITDTSKLYTFFLSLGLALGAMAASMYIIDNIDDVDNALLTMMAMFVILIGVAAAMSKLQVSLGKVDIVSLIAMAGSIFLLILALKLLIDLNLSFAQIMQAVVGLGLIMLAFGATLKMSSGFGGNALTIIATVIAIKMIVGMLDDIASMDLGSIKAALPKLIGFFIAFIGLMAITRLAGKNALGAGVMLIGMGVSILLMAEAVKILAGIDQNSIGKAVGAINGFMVIMGLVVLASKFAGDNAMKAGVMLLAMSASIMILTVSIMLLSLLDPNDLKSATIVISVLMVIMGGIVFVSKFANANKSLIVMLVAVVVSVVGAIAILTLLADETGNMERATACIAAVLLCITLFVGAASLFKSGAATALLLAVAADLLLAGILLLLWGLQELKIEPALETMAGISMLLLSMSEAVAILSLVKTFPVAGLAAFAAFVAELGLILAGLAELNELTKGELQNLLDEGIPILASIGEGLGTFIGSLIGSIGEGLMDSLEKMGASLEKFSEHIKPFIENIKGVDNDTTTKAGIVAECVGAFGDTAFKNAFEGLANGDLADIGNKLNTFGNYVVAFADKMSGIKMDYLTAGTTAATSLGELAASVHEWEDGDAEKLVNLGAQLAWFAPNFKQFINQLTGLDTGVLDSVGTSFSGLGDFVSALCGGETSDYFDYDLMIRFGEALADFGPHFNVFSMNMYGINEKAIENAIGAAEVVRAFAEEIPNDGGALGLLVGNNDIGKFGESIEKFSGPFSRACLIFNGINETMVDNAMAAAEVVRAFAEEIPNSGGALAYLIGDNTLDGFGSELAAFAPNFVTFCDTVKDITMEQVLKPIDAMWVVLNFAQAVQNGGGDFMTIDYLSGRLAALGTAMSDFATNLGEGTIGKLSGVSQPLDALFSVMARANDITTNGVDNLVTNVDSLVALDLGGFVDKYSNTQIWPAISGVDTIKAMLGRLQGVDFSGAESFKTAMSNLATTTITDFIHEFSNAPAKVSGAIEAFFSKVISTIRDKKKTFETAGKELISSLSTGLGSTVNVSGLLSSLSSVVSQIRYMQADFWTAGSWLMVGLKNGINDNAASAVRAASKVGSDAVKALNNAIQVKSPSKETYRSGKFFDIGLANAIDDYSKLAEDSAGSMAERAMGAVNGTLLEFDRLAHNTGRATSISPVIDLSGARSGANQINAMFSKQQALNASYDVSNTNHKNDIQRLVEINQKMLATIEKGGDVYLDDRTIIGRLNYSLGALM